MCEYALERLGVSGDGTRVRQRHSKYYRALPKAIGIQSSARRWT